VASAARRRETGPEHPFELQAKAARTAPRAVRAGWRMLRLGVLGNRHQWKRR